MDEKRKKYIKEYQEKTKRVSITLTNSEYQLLEKESKKIGVKPTTFLKHNFLNSVENKKNISLEDKESLKEFVQVVRGIGNNINQMAKHSNIFYTVLNKKKVFKNLEELEKEVIKFTHKG